MFTRFSHAPYPKAMGHQHAKTFLGTLYMRADGVKNINHILQGDQTILEKKFYRVVRPRHLTWPKLFVTPTLKHSLFAAANLL